MYGSHIRDQPGYGICNMLAEPDKDSSFFSWDQQKSVIAQYAGDDPKLIDDFITFEKHLFAHIKESQNLSLSIPEVAGVDKKPNKTKPSSMQSCRMP
jgi:hypothetical protein